MPCVCNAAAKREPTNCLQRIRWQLENIRKQLRTGKTSGKKGRSLEPHELAFLQVRELEHLEKRRLAAKRKLEEMTLTAKQRLAECQEKLAENLDEAGEAHQLAGRVRARADAAEEPQRMVAVPTPSRRRRTHRRVIIDEARCPEMGRETFGQTRSPPQEEAEDVEKKELPRHDRAYERERGREHGVDPDGADAMVAQLGGPEADGGADGGSDHSATVLSMDEELFAYIGPAQRRKEAQLAKKADGSVALHKRRCKLYKVRAQLRSGKMHYGRVLRQQKLTSVRTREAALMKKQNSRRVVRELQHIRTQLRHIRTQLRTRKTRGTKGRSLESHELAFLRVRELELVEKRRLAAKWKFGDVTLVAKQSLAESPEKLAANPEEAVEARQLAGWVRARADAADADAEHQLMVAVPAPSRRRKTHNGTTIDEARVPEMGRDPQVPAESNVLETFGRAPSTPQEEAEDVETKKLPRHDRAYERERGREHGVDADGADAMVAQMGGPDADDVEKQELPGHDRAHDREQGREHGSENERTRATEASMVALLLEQTEHYCNMQRKKEYDDYTCHRILRDSRCRGVVDTKMVRGWIRHEAAWRGDRDVAAAIRAAVYRASDAGVVRLLPQPAPRGRLVLVFQKLTWTEMERSEAAHVFLESIGLGAASFDP